MCEEKASLSETEKQPQCKSPEVEEGVNEYPVKFMTLITIIIIAQVALFINTILFTNLIKSLDESVWINIWKI